MFFFSSRRRHTRFKCDWSSDVCSSDFTADREHIHHKLLQRGMSHRQVVIVLYGVSAIFALLSLFLLWPTGSTLGLVLAVLGTGIWIGVQHLGYLEFAEIRRVAQRTIEHRPLFVNNIP